MHKCAYVRIMKREWVRIIIPTGKTPYKAWYKSKPDVSYFRVFGCTSYVNVKKDKRRPLQSHT